MGWAARDRTPAAYCARHRSLAILQELPVELFEAVWRARKRTAAMPKELELAKLYEVRVALQRGLGVQRQPTTAVAHRHTRTHTVHFLQSLSSMKYTPKVT